MTTDNEPSCYIPTLKFIEYLSQDIEQLNPQFKVVYRRPKNSINEQCLTGENQIQPEMPGNLSPSPHMHSILTRLRDDFTKYANPEECTFWNRIFTPDPHDPRLWKWLAVHPHPSTPKGRPLQGSDLSPLSEGDMEWPHLQLILKNDNLFTIETYTCDKLGNVYLDTRKTELNETDAFKYLRSIIIDQKGALGY